MFRRVEALPGMAPGTRPPHHNVMSSFIVTSQTDRDGEAQTAVFAPTAQAALVIAEGSRPGAMILAPDRETYDVAEFRRALDAGKFGDDARHAEPG